MRVNAGFSRLLRLDGIWVRRVQFNADRVVVWVALRRRRDTCRFQDVAHQGGRDVDAKLAQLADDSDVTPAGVLAGQPQHEFAHLAVDRRPAGTPVRIRPMSGHEPPMPAQERFRPYQECLPRAARQHPTERRE